MPMMANTIPLDLGNVYISGVVCTNSKTSKGVEIMVSNTNYL